ncbi:MAG: PAS domain-containing protein [Anaerolineae bacterium]|nr:PAS domain-containing protein [Anaerolineae bacterium]
MQQLRDMLHTIATQADTPACVTALLEFTLPIAGAVGAGFRASGGDAVTIGERPEIDLGDVSSLGFAEIDPVSGAVVCPVRQDANLLGVLWLTLEPGYHLTEADRETLAVVADGLALVAARDRDQRRSERAELMARSLLDGNSDLLLVFDDARRLEVMNPAAEKFFGVTTAVARGKTLRDIVQADDLVAFAEGMLSLSEWSRGDSVFVPRVQPVVDKRGRPAGSILCLRDITRFNRLIQSQHEFLRVVSHDVRTPLTSIGGFAAILGTVGEVNDKQTLFVEKILNGVTQITNLVDNIQDAGRYDVETGFYEMSRSECDLRTIVTRIVNNHLLPAEKQELTLTCSVDADVPIINADAIMLERGIANLVDNAIKYTPNGGKIDVLVTRRDRDVVISVCDNGFGISPENQKRLFQRHVRIMRQEHKKVKGTGLGLFIVKSVAQRHGGDAWVESQENVGSTFSFNIPLKGANLPDAVQNAR